MCWGECVCSACRARNSWSRISSLLVLADFSGLSIHGNANRISNSGFVHVRELSIGCVLKNSFVAKSMGAYPGHQHSIPIQSHRTSAVLYETAPMPTAINTTAFFQLNNLSISPRPGYHLGPLNFRISSADFSHSA